MLNKLFSLIWRKRLADINGQRMRVVKVTGWNSAIVDGRFGRKHVWFEVFTKEDLGKG